MRLIDADKLLNIFENTECDVCESFADEYFSHGFSIPLVRKILKDIPTVDAVPVVRCRDCKYSRECNENEKQLVKPKAIICTNPNFTEDGWNAVWPHDFCPYGESDER